jgi:7-cyano-7-deazaguanine reductase
MRRDLSNAAQANVQVVLFSLADRLPQELKIFSGVCLDLLDISCNTYQVQPNFLCTADEIVTETIYSDLLKSNCLVTGQPDWGSVRISYTGRKIQQEGLLKYIVSFRNHNEFHEQCVERIFMDLLRQCAPQSLTVEARYTRRGGLDINPFRSTDSTMEPTRNHLVRQ